MVAILALAALAACGGGDPAPLDAAEQAVAGTFCSNPTFSASRASPYATQALLSAASGCGYVAPEYRFLVRPPGAAAYAPLREYGPERDFVWDFAGRTSGRYTLLVYVRPAGSTAPYDAYATVGFDVGDVCASAALETSLDGTRLDLSASASCTGTGTPEYSFLVKAPGAPKFTEVRAYSGNPTFSYLVVAPGRYEVLAYARAAGNASAYEGAASRSVAVGPACSSVTLVTAQDGAPHMDLVADATCGVATPEFRFLARGPGETTFVEIRPWGPAATHLYVPGGPDGRYELQVWARAQGNASDWEAQATVAKLVGRACTSATLAARWDGAALVELAASAACRDDVPAEYRFLVRRPGATTFVELLPYRHDPRPLYFLPPGSPPGRYEFQVQARATGNRSAWEATAGASALVGPTCSAATLAARYDGPSSRVELSADATCPGEGEFRFLARRPGATAFSEIRPYGPAPSLAIAVPPDSGRWEFQVQARLAVNPSDYETAATVSTFVGRTCTLAGLSARLDASTSVLLAASATCAGATPEYRFLVRRPGEAVFADLRPYHPEPGFQFEVYPFVAGRYEFKVLARAAGNASDWEGAATASVSVGPSCPAATLSARLDGGAVHLSSFASCTEGARAEYRFMARRPGAAAFEEVRPYFLEPSFLLPLDPFVPGRWEFQVHVRAPGNPSDYEATARATALVGVACSSAALSAKLADPFAGPVDLAASAVCGSAPAEYRFLVKRPGTTSFAQLRGWGQAPTHPFDPGLAAPGRYEFQVWARVVGNRSEYEALAAATVFVGGSCSSAFLDAMPDGGGMVSLAAGATCTSGAAPDYRFLVKRPGDAAFTELRPWDPVPFAAFLPWGGPPGGRYEFQVQVRAQGNLSDAEATATVATLLGTTCTGATLAATFDGWATHLAARATCAYGAPPEFRFQVKAPGDAAFTDVRPWAPDPFAFHVPGAPVRTGRYEFQVLARVRGNLSDFEAVARTAVLVGPTCSAATLTATPVPGASVVELAATSACGYGDAEYRFLVRRPGEASFVELRPYGADPRLPFFTSDAPPGRYEFQVWVRQAGNVSDQEAIASATTFVGAACSAAALQTWVNDQSAGVELTASASCRYAAPEYRFLHRPPGSTVFRELLPYGPAASTWLSFNAMPPGRHEFQVQVRAAGNPAAESSATASAVIGRACPAAALVAVWDEAYGSGRLVAAAPCQYGGPAEYRFLVKPPGASAFVELRPYDQYPEAPFSAFDVGPGRLEFQVQVRATGNASDYEGQATAAALVGEVCASPALSAVREATGLVRLQADARCRGAGPEFRFLHRRAGAAALTELRRYEMYPEFGWDTTGLAPGAYEVVVQVRRTGSSAPLDAAATLPLELEAP